MPQIYFDHAATSWPKPPVVREALDRYFGDAGGNPGRSGHRMSIAAAQIVEETRNNLAALFNIENPGTIAYTKNATEALNLAIYGLLEPGDHVICTSIEHNSVMRPLRDLETRNVEVTTVGCSSDGTLDPDEVNNAFQVNTRLVVILHGSNVMGTLMPVKVIAELAHRHGAIILVDASQTAGTIPIDVKALGLDLLAFTGHKGLLGLTGTGGLYVRENIALKTLIRGGTGSDSDLETQPVFMPDVYESGTLNVAGLAGLGAGVRYLLDIGVDNVATHERNLTDRFLMGAKNIGNLVLYGPTDSEQRCGVLSFNIAELTPSEVGTLLDQKYGIMGRVGLHCAPGAHKTLGTFPQGTIRFSFGYSNTKEEVDICLQALQEISAWSKSINIKTEVNYA